MLPNREDGDRVRRENGRERERERERERNVELCGGYAKADDRGYPRLLAELLLLNDYVT